MLNALQRRVEHVDHIACSLTVPHASKRGKRARTTPGKPTVSGSVVRIDRASVVLRRLFLCGFCILPDLIRRVCLISRAFFLFRKRICLYHRLYFKRVIRHELFEEVAIHFFMVIQVMGNLMQLILMLLQNGTATVIAFTMMRLISSSISDATFSE